MEQINSLQHKPTLKVIIMSYNYRILIEFIRALTKELQGRYYYGPFFLPEEKKIFCVLRSPFVNKDSRDHFELRLYSVKFYSKFATEENLLKFLKLFMKKLSFKITNNILIKLAKI